MVLESSLILVDGDHGWVNDDARERGGAFELVDVGVGVAYCVASEHAVHIVGRLPINCGVYHEFS